MQPPLFYRLVFNPVRRWMERDTGLLVEQWKAAFGPKPRKVVPINLLVIRGRRAEGQRRMRA